MKIKKFDLVPINAYAGGGSTALGVLVKYYVQSEFIGLGEVPTDDQHISTSYAAVSQWLNLYSNQILGAECADINAINRLLDEADEGGRSGCPPARAAVEMAVYDLIGKARNSPLHQVLGGGYHDVLGTVGEVALYDDEVVRSALDVVAGGNMGVRLNTIGDTRQSATSADAQYAVATKILSVLHALGGQPLIDIVAHQSLGNEARASMLVENLLTDEFRPNLALVQPLHFLDFEGHSRLRDKLPIAIVLEESVTSPQAMSQIVRMGAADRIVLDIWRVGGLRNAKRIANICESAAVGVMVSGRCCSPVGRAALGHLAATIHGSCPVNVGLNTFGSIQGLNFKTPQTAGKISIGTESGLGVAFTSI